MSKTKILLLVFSIISILNTYAVSIKPQGVTVTNTTKTGFTISWTIDEDKTADLTGHTLFFKDQDGNQIVMYPSKDSRSIDFNESVSDDNYTINILPGHTYSIGIFAEPVDWDNADASAVWINATTIPQYVLPQNLVVRNTTSTSFSVTWDIAEEEAENITGHTIILKDANQTTIYLYPGKDARSYDFSGEYSDGTNSFTVSPESEYAIGIYTQPEDWAGNSSSAWINAITVAAEVTAQPTAPFNPIVSSVTPTSFTISWENDINATQGTNIFLNDGAQWVTTVGEGVTSYTFENGKDNVSIGSTSIHQAKLQALPDEDYNAYTSTIEITTNVITNVSNDVTTTVYPNPCNDFLTISRVDNLKEVIIYSTSGKIVHRVNNVSNGRINTSDLSSGMYFVKVTSDHTSTTIDFIKK